MNRILATLLLSLSATAPVAQADLLLFDIDADPSGWALMVAGLSAETAYDFTADPDYFVTGFSSPLTSAGSGPVSAGTVADGVTIAAAPGEAAASASGLVGVGPSAGYGNPLNAVLTNAPGDSYTVLFAEPVVAFAVNILSVFGSDFADITVGGVLFEDVVTGGSIGRNIGFLGTDGMTIGSVSIYDRQAGTEGVQGVGTIYREQTGLVSSPATLTLVGLALVGMAGRGRRHPS